MVSVKSLPRLVVSGLAVLGVLAYAAAALVTFVDVVGRNLGMPIEGVVDLVQLFVVAGAWLVIPFAFQSAAHVGVDFVLNMLPAALKLPLRVLAALVALAVIGLMLWYGFETFKMRTMFGDRSQQLGIPVAWYWYPLLVGLAASLIGILVHLAEAVRKDRKEARA
ncbi:TRAP transporter small permease [Pseudodonghicola flavimaris]|uniref:TRAP transporter small permease protein n=1 Tax=Pseudodonghicola flavimaris TaxID=3050036 RepID=A0ABT7F5S1_9RHOB|nr:TRAP transporter small permease [Pseudodonghicola flavimaris]MDK3019956.1 TRAP transporter small permease [Pseudodonghicola flavimaris]